MHPPRENARGRSPLLSKLGSVEGTPNDCVSISSTQLSQSELAKRRRFSSLTKENSAVASAFALGLVAHGDTAMFESATAKAPSGHLTSSVGVEAKPRAVGQGAPIANHTVNGTHTDLTRAIKRKLPLLKSSASISKLPASSLFADSKTTKPRNRTAARNRRVACLLW